MLILTGVVLWLSFFFTSLDAFALKKDQYCFDTCYEAYSSFIFAGDDPLLYYLSTCTYAPKILSIYASATVYCKPEEIQPGIDLLERYCEEYGPDLKLLPISDFKANLTKSAIAKMPVLSAEDGAAAEEPFDYPIVISQSLFDSEHRTVVVWEKSMRDHKIYGWAMYGFWGGILLIGIVKNLVDFLLEKRFDQHLSDPESRAFSKVQLPSALARSWDFFNRHFVLAFTLGTRHQRRWWGCTMPTRLVSIVVAIAWILNLVLSAVSIDAFKGNMYWPEISAQVWRYVADRTGILSFANLPILWMFAGRNNIFLWATGWKYSTFSIYHRHVARIATLQAIVHSIAWTELYLVDGKALYYAQYKEMYWCVGVAATVIMSVMLVASISWARDASYEFFLIGHILMSVATIVTLFYHVTIMDGEYNGYLWPLVAIWGFDRLLRIVRLVYCNIRVHSAGKQLQTTTAKVSYDETSGVIELNIHPGSYPHKPKAGQYYFVYQPVHWKGWESHPFTLGAWTDLMDHESKARPSVSVVRTGSKDVEANVVSGLQEVQTERSQSDSDLNPSRSEPALTFWIKSFDGFTRRIAKACRASPDGTSQMRVLMEGPYGHHAPLHQFESVLLIAGGTGISGVLPYLLEHLQRLRTGIPTRTRTIQLVFATKKATFIDRLSRDWLRAALNAEGVRVDFFATREKGQSQEKLVPEASSPVSPKSDSGDSDSIALDNKKGAARSTVRLASIHFRRPNIVSTVVEFARANNAAGTNERTAVLVCGPPGMADEARASVLIAGEEHLNVEYLEDAFGW